MTDTKTEGRKLADHIQPTGDRVLVRCLRENRKIGSIILPDNLKQGLDVMVSEVVALGPDVKARKWELQVGDFVLHVRVVGVGHDGVMGVLGLDSQKKEAEHKFLRESDILAIVDPGAVVQGAASYSEGRTGSWSQGDA